jgi:hypothetical protein
MHSKRTRTVARIRPGTLSISQLAARKMPVIRLLGSR